MKLFFLSTSWTYLWDERWPSACYNNCTTFTIPIQLSKKEFVSAFYVSTLLTNEKSSHRAAAGRKWKNKFRKSVRAVVFNPTCVSIIFSPSWPSVETAGSLDVGTICSALVAVVAGGCSIVMIILQSVWTLAPLIATHHPFSRGYLHLSTICSWWLWCQPQFSWGRRGEAPLQNAIYIN